jgi:hypothetical protein
MKNMLNLDEENLKWISYHHKILIESIKKFNVEEYAIESSTILLYPFWAILYFKSIITISIISVITMILSIITGNYLLIIIGLIILVSSLSIWAYFNWNIMNSEKNPYLKLKDNPWLNHAVKRFYQYYKEAIERK